MAISIKVAHLPNLLLQDWQQDNIAAVVIDTLRFTSTAVVALHAGAESISVAGEVDEAIRLGAQLGRNSLLCGERHCHRIENFHLGNSPLEYVSEVVGSRPLVFSTTNGTRAVEAVKAAPCILLGSLLNRTAVAQQLLQHSSGTVWIVCAGTDGEIALEDVLAAGAILSGLQSRSAIQLGNDSAWLALKTFESIARDDIEENLRASMTFAAGGKNLVRAGYDRDIAEVARLDSFFIVPQNSLDARTTFRDSCKLKQRT